MLANLIRIPRQYRHERAIGTNLCTTRARSIHRTTCRPAQPVPRVNHLQRPGQPIPRASHPRYHHQTIFCLERASHPRYHHQNHLLPRAKYARLSGDQIWTTILPKMVAGDACIFVKSNSDFPILIARLATLNEMGNRMNTYVCL
jgi:hypothetical protein